MEKWLLVLEKAYDRVDKEAMLNVPPLTKGCTQFIGSQQGVCWTIE